MPRIDADSTDRSPENGAPASRLTPGVRLPRACMSTRLRLCMASAVNAVTAIGTFWIFSSRRSAVTTISSRPPDVSAAAGEAGVSCEYARYPPGAPLLAAPVQSGTPKCVRFSLLGIPNAQSQSGNPPRSAHRKQSTVALVAAAFLEDCPQVRLRPVLRPQNDN